MKFYLTALAVIILFGAAIAGSYQIFQAHMTNRLEARAESSLASGDYLSSLQNYAALTQTAGTSTSKTTKNLSAAKDMLVAEEILVRAQKEADDGNWFAVKALLQRGEATTNTSFKHYEKAVDLYVEASNRVKEIERKIETELAQMREEALTEKRRREQAEQRQEQAEETAEDIKEELASTQKQKSQTEQQLQQTKQEAAEAKKQARQERLEKFINELGLYADMLARGVRYLQDAIDDVERDSNLSARAFVDQAELLFKEVSTRAVELRENRAPSEHKEKVRMISQAAAVLKEAAQKVGSASFTDDEEEVQDLLAKARHNRNDANELLGQVRSFINNER